MANITRALGLNAAFKRDTGHPLHRLQQVALLIDVKAHTDFLSVAANTYLAATDLMRRLSHDAVEECKPFLL